MQRKFIPISKEQMVSNKEEPYEFESIASEIKVNGYNSRANREDLFNFGLWEKGQISDEECLRRFLTSNEINKQYPISYFVKWLNSLGWRKT